MIGVLTFITLERMCWGFSLSKLALLFLETGGWITYESTNILALYNPKFGHRQYGR